MASTTSRARKTKDVDGRDKPGHDVEGAFDTMGIRDRINA
jgi:hypothetical protein